LDKFFLSVWRDPDHVKARGAQLLHGGGEVDRLRRAPRRHCSGVEVDNHALSGEVSERHILAVGVGQGKGWRGVTVAEPNGHAKTLAAAATSFDPQPRARAPVTLQYAVILGRRNTVKGGYVSNDSPQPTRTPSQIEADLGATRDRLATSVEALIDQVHPNRIKQRQIANVKHFANTELENAKSKIFNARGDLRTDRIAVIAAAVAGIVGFLLIIRAIARRGSSD
jgi:hypothetical protein